MTSKVTLPANLQPGQFQGLFFENVETEFTTDVMTGGRSCGRRVPTRIKTGNQILNRLHHAVHWWLRVRIDRMGMAQRSPVRGQQPVADPRTAAERRWPRQFRAAAGRCSSVGLLVLAQRQHHDARASRPTWKPCKRVGIGGVLIMEVDQGAPVGPVDFMSAQLARAVPARAAARRSDSGWKST